MAPIVNQEKSVTAMYTAKVEIKSGRDGKARSDDGRLEVPLAFQTVLGGTGAGSNPEQLLAAAWGACFASSLGLVAREDGKPLSELLVQVEIDLLKVEANFSIAGRIIVMPRAEDAGRVQRLIDSARKVCPYSRALDTAISAEYSVRS